MSVRQIESAFQHMFDAFHERSFTKSYRLCQSNERTLLPLMRMFLRGWFGRRMSPEVPTKLKSAVTGKGRVDFVLGGIPVEVVVRLPEEAGSKLKAIRNNTELQKLLLHRGRAVLVLLDFSDVPLSRGELETSYRNWREPCEFGQGYHGLTPFSVCYFYRQARQPASEPIALRIRT